MGQSGHSLSRGAMSVVRRSMLGNRPGRRKRPRHRRRLATGLAVIALFCVMPPAAATTSIAAAGDISNAPGGPRHDRLTAELIRRWNPTAVLALGDVQYEAGELVNFRRPTTGRGVPARPRRIRASGTTSTWAATAPPGTSTTSARRQVRAGSGTTRSTSAPGMSLPSTPAAPWSPTGGARTGRRNGRG